MRVLISPHLCQHLSLSVLVIAVTLVGVKWFLTVVLIGISLMTNNVERIFGALLTICRSSWEKCVFISFAHLKTGLSFSC